MSRLEKIPFRTEDGEVVELYVLEQTMIGGYTYLLVEEGDPDEESVVYIMKGETGTASEEESSFVFVEDETELVSVMKVFEQLMEDADFVQDF